MRDGGTNPSHQSDVDRRAEHAPVPGTQPASVRGPSVGVPADPPLVGRDADPTPLGVHALAAIVVAAIIGLSAAAWWALVRLATWVLT